MATVHEESRTHTSTTSAERPLPLPAFGDGDRSDHDPFQAPRPVSSRSRVGRLVVLAAVLGGIAAAVYFAWPQISSLLGSEPQIQAATYTVQRDRLRVVVTEDGNVESASNVDVKCRVAGGSTILWIVEDGKFVEAGEEIVRLDQAALEDQFNTQKGVYETTLAAHIQARENFEAAKIAVQEYQEGTLQKELQLVESQITVAQQNLRSAQDMLGHTERMVRKNFATPLQFEADQFAVKRAGLDLDAANIAKKALVEFTGPKTIRELEAARDAAEATLRSATANLELEKAKLDRLEEQLTNCIITAPQSGMVVYANERSRFGSSQASVEEGALVRDRQTILRIPDLTNMQVKVSVHESKVDQIKLGLPAEIRIGDRDKMAGRVLSIANQPESTNWFSANVKEYATIVKIDGETAGLKPGMTAIVQIEIADRRDVLTVPVSAVVEQGRKLYAWVKTPQGPERRELLPERFEGGQQAILTNDKVIAVADGLTEGDQVYLNPRTFVREASTEPAAEEGQPPAEGSQPTDGSTAPGDDRPTAAAEPPIFAAPADERGQGDAAGPGGGRRQLPNFAELDTDGDGKISRDEAPERMQENFDRIDTDGDGFIDAREHAAMRSRAAAGGGRGPGGPGAPGGGAPGAGRTGAP